MTLLFYHIPKTAGTTFTALCGRRYAGQPILEINQFEDRDALAELEAMTQEQRAQLAYVRAHATPVRILDLFPKAVAVCFLRDPVDRVVSAYRHVERAGDHPLHDHLVRSGMTLQQYASSRHSEQCGQTRLLSGVEGADWATGHGDLGPEVREHAIENLSRFHFVGLTERFEDSLLVLRKLLGWSLLDIVFTPENVAPSSQQGTAMPWQAREHILAVNRYDADLYAAAQARFDAALADLGPSIEGERKLLRALNLPYTGHRRLKARSPAYSKVASVIRRLHSELHR